MKIKKRAVLLLTLMTMALVAVASPAWADATFTVNTTGDEGDEHLGDGTCAIEDFLVGTEPECTLRAAIQEANATTAPDIINFRIGGSGVKTISPGSSLPVITQPVTIDGYTEPGASKNTKAVGQDNAVLLIRLDGKNAGFAAGLNITANDSVVRGLSITGFSSSAGLVLSGADHNTIEGNFIGTNPGGTRKDLGNGWGLFLQRHFSDSTNKPSGNTIGGTSPEARNIISGNSTGVEITSGGGNEANKVQGNYIGTTKSGTGDLGNSSGGVSVSFQGANNIIGGDGAARNTIAFNGQDGVKISGAAVTSNRILSNSIFSNADLGIDLNDDGRTANDPQDPDTGPNRLQNFPVLASATTSGGSTTIQGTLNSTPGQTFTVRFFSNPSGNEGKKFIGQTKVVFLFNKSAASFTFTPDQSVAVGQKITATATTEFGGDTSEFSAAIPVS
jgi:CSLREA domain-containing protein